MKGTDIAANEKSRKARARQIALKLRPKNLTADENKEWARVAGMLADPVLDRLKPHFVDAALMLVRINLRIAEYDKFFRENAEADDPLAGEVYEVVGRNGNQLKSHPHVAQRNEAWRQWRSVISLFGLTPTDERNMAPGQSDLFDPASEFD